VGGASKKIKIKDCAIVNVAYDFFVRHDALSSGISTTLTDPLVHQILQPIRQVFVAKRNCQADISCMPWRKY
jgi:hypothetical protein